MVIEFSLEAAVPLACEQLDREVVAAWRKNPLVSPGAWAGRLRAAKEKQLVAEHRLYYRLQAGLEGIRPYANSSLTLPAL